MATSQVKTMFAKNMDINYFLIHEGGEISIDIYCVSASSNTASAKKERYDILTAEAFLKAGKEKRKSAT